VQIEHTQVLPLHINQDTSGQAIVGFNVFSPITFALQSRWTTTIR
jgi:hypothetical protein